MPENFQAVLNKPVPIGRAPAEIPFTPDQVMAARRNDASSDATALVTQIHKMMMDQYLGGVFEVPGVEAIRAGDLVERIVFDVFRARGWEPSRTRRNTWAFAPAQQSDPASQVLAFLPGGGTRH